MGRTTRRLGRDFDLGPAGMQRSNAALHELDRRAPHPVEHCESLCRRFRAQDRDQCRVAAVLKRVWAATVAHVGMVSIDRGGLLASIRAGTATYRDPSHSVAYSASQITSSACQYMAQ